MENLKYEDLELMSYDDIAYEVLKENGAKMTIKDLFGQIIKLLGLSNEEYENHVGDFFEILSTDKRFIMLENGYWDLRVNHSHKIKIEEDDDDFIDDLEIEEVEDVDDEDEEIDDDVDPEDDEAEDDLKDLSVISEDDKDDEDDDLM